jgi:DNA-binding XRE family transcriptional regulator
VKPKNKIKYFREKRELTQVELGRILGISQTAVSLYESGDRNPDVEMAKAIAKALNQTLDAIFAP